MDKVINLLKKNKVMTVATSSGGKPRSSIVEYVMVGDAMVFMTNPQTIKAKNLAKNKKISITVGKIPKDIMKAVYVAIDGTAQPAGAAEKEGYNKELFARYPMFEEMGDFLKTAVYFRIKFKTAYYSVGMAPAEKIKYKK
jgi:uncharacterized pyridoxamine 5'-phosphate oxidase family protein